MTFCSDTDHGLPVCRPLALSGAAAACFFIALGLLAGSGCRREKSPSSAEATPAASQAKSKVTDELLHHAINALYRLEEFEGGEMLQRTIDRLDQWVHEQKPLADWKPDPMLATLPKPLAELEGVKDLGKLEFKYSDGLALQETVWHRDASNWAKGEDVADLARAKALFDWTVRNIQLQEDRSSGPDNERVVQLPWETLLLGRGTAWERAWVFILLARQQGMDAVVLGLPAQAPATDKVEPWTLAVLSEGQLYLFDPLLGVPIPAPNGIQLNDQGQLEIQPATLAQVTADEKLLRQLDVDAEHPYPIKSAQLPNVVALLEGSPAYLQQKMAMVETRLVGTERMVLTAAPSAQAERLKATKQIKDARLWTLPYDVLAQRKRLGAEAVRWQQMMFLPFQAGLGQNAVLWKGRVLHLKGMFNGEPSAATYYQMARPSDRELAAAPMPRQMQAVILLGKLDASYWLGLIAATQGNYRSAIDYLSQRTLLQALDNGPWTPGAHYNLGRVYEAQRAYAKALEKYRLASSAPDHTGNLLRAKWLEQTTTGKGSSPTPASAETKTSPAKPVQESPSPPSLPTLPTLPDEKPKTDPSKK